jgi:hypothetical protein
LLFATLGAAAHRDHGAGSDAACVVHHWAQAGKSAVVSPALAFSISFSFSHHTLSTEQIVVASRLLRATSARAPPVA